MSDLIPTDESAFQLPRWTLFKREPREQKFPEALSAALRASLMREKALLREKNDLLQRQDMLAQEFDHRLMNGLQLIVSQLSFQSRGAPPAVAAQFAVAAKRLIAFGRAHQRLHVLDRQDKVEFVQYLRTLSEDLASVLLPEEAGRSITVVGAKLEIPTRLAIPLGLIVTEMITNSAKYADGPITVQLEAMPSLSHSLSVLDCGPGLPVGFDPRRSKGKGMKIVLSLVKEIGGALQMLPGELGRGGHFAITFRAPGFGTGRF